MQETPVRFLDWEDPLEKGPATHSSILAWRIPWTMVAKSWTRLNNFHFSLSGQQAMPPPFPPIISPGSKFKDNLHLLPDSLLGYGGGNSENEIPSSSAPLAHFQQDLISSRGQPCWSTADLSKFYPVAHLIFDPWYFLKLYFITVSL